MNLNGLEITWLGHAAVRIRRGDATIYLDPWLAGNPACPEAEHQPAAVDAIYLTHGHFDHFGNTMDLVAAHSPQVFCIHEIAEYLTARGVENVVGSNKGGTVDGPAGVRATLVDAVHSSGISADDGSIADGGDPGGWILEFPGGPTILHAGDTTVFGDMALIAELYRPEIGFLPIGGHFTMDPAGAAMAAQMLGLDVVVPIHYGTFPILAGTPEELRTALDGSGIDVIAPEIGETLTFSVLSPRFPSTHSRTDD